MTLFEVGNPRMLPTWQQYLESVAYRYLSEKLTEPYFFFVLGPIETPNPFNNNEWDDFAILNGLRIMKEYNDKIFTVFKPHPLTNMAQFQKMLEDIEYKNYIILNIHPFIISKKAKFALSLFSSTVLVDVHDVGCPTIDFVHYDGRGMDVIGQNSLLNNYVDYYIDGDEEELKATVDGLLNKDATPSDRISQEKVTTVPLARRMSEILELA